MKIIVSLSRNYFSARKPNYYLISMKTTPEYFYRGDAAMIQIVFFMIDAPRDRSEFLLIINRKWLTNYIA